MSSPRVLYLVYREGLSAVFHTRVAQPQGDLHNDGYFTRLVVFAPLGELIRPSLREKWVTARANIRRVFDGPLNLLPSPPSRWVNAWDDAALLRRWSSFHLGSEPFVIHCRGPQAAFLGLALRRIYPKARVLFDMRGLTSAELLYRNDHISVQDAPSEVRDGVVEAFSKEQLATQDSDTMICVSHAMKEYVVSTFGVDESKITVVPNYVFEGNYATRDVDRDTMRAELDLENNFVVTYSGSIKRRQNPMSGLKLFSMVKKAIPSAHYLVLTPNEERMRGYVGKSGVEQRDVTICTVAPHEVPRYLAAGDIGLITMGMMIPPFIAHNVSSPIKFAEYLASGTPVILSENIADFSQIVAETSTGVVTHVNDSDEQVSTNIHSFLERNQENPDRVRTRCVQVAQERLSWSVHRPRIEALYNSLLA